MFTLKFDSAGTAVYFEQPLTAEARTALVNLGFTFYPTWGEGYAADYWQAGYSVDPTEIEHATGLQDGTYEKE